eukprot:6202051-Pleurochrysis_carterae.AAC.2
MEVVGEHTAAHDAALIHAGRFGWRSSSYLALAQHPQRIVAKTDDTMRQSDAQAKASDMAKLAVAWPLELAQCGPSKLVDRRRSALSQPLELVNLRSWSRTQRTQPLLLVRLPTMLLLLRLLTIGLVAGQAAAVGLSSATVRAGLYKPDSPVISLGPDKLAVVQKDSQHTTLVVRLDCPGIILRIHMQRPSPVLGIQYLNFAFHCRTHRMHRRTTLLLSP